MTFCTRCGRQIEDGQICECVAQAKNIAMKTTFCTRCGKPIKEGQRCPCTVKKKLKTDAMKTHKFIVRIKNRMGIGAPKRNETDCYERNMRIVPDSISASENEIPIKQYSVAVLRTLLKFERAEGRIQVTNKRVLFRACGRSVGGRTTLQHEFAIDEIAGIEARNNYKFSFLHLLFGLIVISFGFGIIVSLGGLVTRLADNQPDYVISAKESEQIAIQERITAEYEERTAIIEREYAEEKEKHASLEEKSIYETDRINAEEKEVAAAAKRELAEEAETKAIAARERAENIHLVIWRSIMIIAVLLTQTCGVVLFFPVRNKSTRKLFFVSCCGSPLAFVCLFFFCFRPNLIISIKNKSGVGDTGPIDIRRDTLAIKMQEKGTGFAEIIPTDETEHAIREINAMITDIQKLGDFGLEKWTKA